MIWFVFAAMTALAVGGILRPLLRPTVASASRADYDLTVYRDQLEEITRDVERGLLSADQAEAARTEIQRRMLASAEAEKFLAKPDIRAGRRIAMAIVVVLPLFALGFYMSLGAPELPDRPYAGRAAQIAEMKERSATIQGMVSRLAERLKASPDDGKGWAMLGRSYRALGDVDGAIDAYGKAVKLLPGDVPVRVDFAVLLLDQADGSALPERAVGLLKEVLVLDPSQPDALYFVGLDAAMTGDKAKAATLWTRLLETLPPDSPGRGQVQQQIDGLK
ncbi:c-type cytochrome biogenesis protein CcmI [Paramagnetospirillum marisnigri]|uniref:C-type cytochrome biogenesis protein CcmI n=1 Tax=Paramagnetospirillum marisnigri TaxID=1285242 RepID=A0A178MJC9_9PROT|nr:c-type cytochrome biogenesis protein CcmI [Paramagnetospirillum marisnigri]OAN48114.1 c-type cytochrome biogenesis protein CcmI [Paramagnetospirillum marisnigri]